MYEAVRKFAVAISVLIRSPLTFVLSLIALVVLGMAKSYFHYSSTQKHVINPSTPTITFLKAHLFKTLKSMPSVITKNCTTH
jgi:low affinity Fe/Cu permease